MIDFEKLTNSKTVWPNDLESIPNGILPFKGLLVPQGFLSAGAPGQLSIINLDDPNRMEYIIHQSMMNTAFPPGHPNNLPRSYHHTLFHDMDDDGLLDIVTIHSGFSVLANVSPPITYPPFSELIWFRNLGNLLDPTTPWQQVVLYGGPFEGFSGPNIDLAIYDFEGNRVPKIVAMHFFTGFSPTNGKIALYGAPVGGTWVDVNAYSSYSQPQVATISDNQGLPFEIDILNLNADGNVDILATNHEGTDCLKNPTIPGHIYTLEQLDSGDILNDVWPVRVLVDNILPQPNMFGSNQLALGHIVPFYLKGMGSN